jgi:hypothetical protein
MAWDRRVSWRLGLRFDDPHKSASENIALAQRRRRFWLRPPIVVEEDDLLTTDAAMGLLRRRGHRPNGNLLIARGILQPCFVSGLPTFCFRPEHGTPTARRVVH